MPALILMLFDGRWRMRITLNIDDDLLEHATVLTGLIDKTALICESLRALIEREIAHEMDSLGGSDSGHSLRHRRRPTFS